MFFPADVGRELARDARVQVLLEIRSPNYPLNLLPNRHLVAGMKPDASGIIFGGGLGLGLLVLSGCNFMGLHMQVQKLESQGVVAVQVSPVAAGAKTYVVATTPGEDGIRESAGMKETQADGLASFSLLNDRTYRVVAFTDENHNGSYDAGEPMAYRDDVNPQALGDPHAGGKMLTLTLTRDHVLPAGTVIEAPRQNEELGAAMELALGEVATLDDPHFASEVGSDGLWRPLDFLSGNKMGIYFLEPYDAKRIPVVLVYGIGGSPQDWRYIIGHLDRSRYQPWFYHYPTGMRLERVGRVLAVALRQLHGRLGFAHCVVVAHSMGGLVAGAGLRELIATGGPDFVSELVTISTPWGGHDAARMGVRRMNFPVPAWKDMVPDSEFFRKLYAHPLPASLPHHLIYGEIPEAPGVPGKDDGTVTVVSELDPRIKDAAASVTHFPYEHVAILNQADTLARLDELLRAK